MDGVCGSGHGRFPEIGQGERNICDNLCVPIVIGAYFMGGVKK